MKKIRNSKIIAFICCTDEEPDNGSVPESEPEPENEDDATSK